MTGYAVTFNLRRERWGHVFQNRCKSIVWEEGSICRRSRAKSGFETPEILRQRRLPKLNDARAAICYLGVRHLGYKCVEVGGIWVGARRGARRYRDQRVLEREPEVPQTPEERT